MDGIRLKYVALTLILFTIFRPPPILQSSLEASFNYLNLAASESYLDLTFKESFMLNRGGQPVPLSEVPSPNLGRYHNYEETVAALTELNERFPHLTELFSIGRSWRGRDLWCIKVTNEAVYGFKPKVLIIGAAHAREVITTDVCLYIANFLTENYAYNYTIRKLLDSYIIYIVPMNNPDGVSIIDQNPWQRKNLRPVDDDGDGLVDEDPPEDVNGNGYIEFLKDPETGRWRYEGIDNDLDGRFNEDWEGGVDLNRNFGYKWGLEPGSSNNPYSQIYRGPSPFSEPENQALKSLAERNDFVAAISFHSGIALILYPWGYTTSPPEDIAIFSKLGSQMSKATGYPHGQGSRILYATSGDFKDYFYGVHKTFAFTIEIYGGSLTSKPNTIYGIWRYFNPPEDEIERYCRYGLAMALILIAGVPTIMQSWKGKTDIILRSLTPRLNQLRAYFPFLISFRARGLLRSAEEELREAQQAYNLENYKAAYMHYEEAFKHVEEAHVKEGEARRGVLIAIGLITPTSAIIFFIYRRRRRRSGGLAKPYYNPTREVYHLPVSQ